MRTSCVKNGLVMVVILLFVGVAVQPGIAVNLISTDNEEDCDICPKVSKTHLVRLKSLIDKVETLNNNISLMSRLNPEVVEKYQELYERITTLKEMNQILKPDYPYPIICNILFYMGFIPFLMYLLFAKLVWDVMEDSILSWILRSLLGIGILILFTTMGLGVSIGCWESPAVPE